MDIKIELTRINIPEDFLEYIKTENDYNKLLENFKKSGSWNIRLYGLDLFYNMGGLERKYENELSKMSDSEQTKVMRDYLSYIKTYWRDKNQYYNFFMYDVDDCALFQDSYDNFITYFSSYQSFPEFLNKEKTPTPTGQLVIKQLEKFLNDFFTGDVPTDIFIYK